MDDIHQTENNTDVTVSADGPEEENKHVSASQKIEKGDTLFTSGTSEMPA